jgi:hypothetical protein
MVKTIYYHRGFCRHAGLERIGGTKLIKPIPFYQDKEKTLCVLPINYGQAGAINYYSKTRNINALLLVQTMSTGSRNKLNYTNAIFVKRF